MRYAETGFFLEVDLTRGNIERVATAPILSGLYLGGQGTAAEILWDRVPPEVEPFSPKNLLVFSAGLLAGTPVPGANRTCVSTINPQTNLYVNSSFEGFFAAEMKHAGYDKIIIRGKAPELVYLLIHNDRVDIRDASHLRGKSAMETATLIRQELNDAKVQVAAIGLAGENKASQANIEHANSSASQGVGVVMGDKGLKAIAVRGTKDLHVAQPAELFALCNRLYGEIHDNPHCGDLLLSESDDSWHVKNLAWRHAGTRVKGFSSQELTQAWAVRVEREEVSYQWENYSQEMEEVHETIVEKSQLLRGTGCYNCPKQCHKAISLPGERRYFLKSFAKLAYAMAAYDDLKLNYDVLFAMQEHGLDELAMAQVFGLVVELYKKGILTSEDLPDFPADGVGRILYLIEKVARRQGIGEFLAEGPAQAVARIGKGADACACIVKKTAQLPLALEAANYPYFLMMATGEATDITQVEGSFPQQPIPDQAQREAFVQGWDAAPERLKKLYQGWAPGQALSPVEAAEVVDWNESMHYADDVLGVCSLLSSFRGQYGGRSPYHLYNLPQLVSLAAGMELDADGLLAIARRNRQLVRAINARRGQRRSDETVAADLWPNRDSEAEQKCLDTYYALKGWTGEGIPAKVTLDALGLNGVSEDLVERGILTGQESPLSGATGA